MKDFFLQLKNAVVNMDDILSAIIAQKIVDEGLDIPDAIEQGLVAGMARAGDLFEQEEYFITELLMCADCVNAAMDVFRPHIAKAEKKIKGQDRHRDNIWRHA